MQNVLEIVRAIFTGQRHIFQELLDVRCVLVVEHYVQGSLVLSIILLEALQSLKFFLSVFYVLILLVTFELRRPAPSKIEDTQVVLV